MKVVNNNRIALIDFMRGFLIVCMIIYHISYDLSEFFSIDINFKNPIYNILQVIGVSIFILLSGIVSNFSKSNIKRGIKIFGVALILTLVTYLFDPHLYIKFGILHFLGIVTLIYHFYKSFSYKGLFSLLIISCIISFFIYNTKVTTPYLFWLGLYNNSFTSLDYVPIFSYIIVFILGNIIGKYLKTIQIKKNILEKNIITFIGRHSLLIYLLHQPIILLIMYLIWG